MLTPLQNLKSFPRRTLAGLAAKVVDQTSHDSRDSPTSQPRWLGHIPTRNFAMKRYLVQSGPLKIMIAAASAYDAALEAVRWWDDDHAAATGDAAHRASLDAVIEVRASRATRPPPLF